MYVNKYAYYRIRSSKCQVGSGHGVALPHEGTVDVNSLPVLSLDGAAAMTSADAESEIGSPNTEDITCLSTSGTVIFTLNGLLLFRKEDGKYWLS